MAARRAPGHAAHGRTRRASVGGNLAKLISDVVPLTPRAKPLLLLESAVSLATVVVVASRAINIPGS